MRKTRSADWLAGIPGIGKIAASAIAASASDPSDSSQGATSSPGSEQRPGKTRAAARPLGGFIAKQGNRYIGRLLVALRDIVGSRVADKRKGVLRDWLVALLARKPARMVAVALANKLTFPG